MMKVLSDVVVLELSDLNDSNTNLNLNTTQQYFEIFVQVSKFKNIITTGIDEENLNFFIDSIELV